MTVPYERRRAVLYTEQFLQSLLDPKVTPRIPKHIRQQAKTLLRHYPTYWDLDSVEKNWTNPIAECPFSEKF